MFGMGLPEIGMILVIALVVFGPGRLPEIGKAVGKSISEFRNATTKAEQEVKKTVALDESK